MESFKFHLDGTLPTNNEIFVFGSNLAGIHGAGAARAAKDMFRAKWGVGRGMTGDCYAIPTKDQNIMSRSMVDIVRDVNQFVDFVNDNPDKQFWITAVGCGLAGFKSSQIAPLFRNCSNNCNFPDTWKQYLEIVEHIQ